MEVRGLESSSQYYFALRAWLRAVSSGLADIEPVEGAGVAGERIKSQPELHRRSRSLSSCWRAS